MSGIRTRVAALALVVTSLVLATACRDSAAEVGGFHLNLTPYAGFGTWGPGVNAQDKLIWGGRVGLGFGRTFGIEGTYGASSADSRAGMGLDPFTQPGIGFPADAVDVKIKHLGVDALFNLAPNSQIVPYIMAGWGQMKFDYDAVGGAETDYSGLEFGAGMKLHFTPRTALRLEARDVTFKFEDDEVLLGAMDERQNNILYTAGLQFTLGGDAGTVDTDADGVSDKKDQCPDTPAGCVVDSKGCPTDADGDGVCDGVDTCPNTPAGVKVDAKGCPTDSDNDGVMDGIDQCPNTAAGCKVDEKGCDVDSDRDGVCDGIDTCANTPTGARVDAKGCPMDSDNDGVYDGLDVCPNTPQGAKVDKDGCPIEITRQEMEMLEKGSITVRNIYFDTAKWDIKPESNQTLTELCNIFQQWPTLQVEIGGHADARGSNAYNLDLSDKRAGAVLEWFRTNCPNMTIANFSSKGYGEEVPVATNKTAKGMALNRRVEFKVLNPEELKRLKERRELMMKESGGK
jgi:outer membrane protein OmpA-like peptidoglycan-associated protein/opacity protein-like surface antigen